MFSGETEDSASDADETEETPGEASS
jgi:hypothetical protein